MLAGALKRQIRGVVLSAQVSTEQPALTPAQTYLLPLFFFLLSHSECRQKQLSHAPSRVPRLSPSLRFPASSEASRALCSQIAGELLPRPSTTYSPGRGARPPTALQEGAGLVTQEGAPRTDATRKDNDAGSQSLGQPVVNLCCTPNPDPVGWLCFTSTFTSRLRTMSSLFPLHLTRQVNLMRTLSSDTFCFREITEQAKMLLTLQECAELGSKFAKDCLRRQNHPPGAI